MIVDILDRTMLDRHHHLARRCPRCDTPTSNVQGIDACPACEWVAPKRERGPPRR